MSCLLSLFVKESVKFGGLGSLCERDGDLGNLVETSQDLRLFVSNFCDLLSVSRKEEETYL